MRLKQIIIFERLFILLSRLDTFQTNICILISVILRISTQHNTICYNLNEQRNFDNLIKLFAKCNNKFKF